MIELTRVATVLAALAVPVCCIADDADFSTSTQPVPGLSDTVSRQDHSLSGHYLDLGGMVVGGEIDSDDTVLDLGQSNATENGMTRFRLRAGVDFGTSVGYGVIAPINSDTPVGTSSSFEFGAGFAMPVTEQWSFGGEVLRQSGSDRTGGDQSDKIKLRALFRL